MNTLKFGNSEWYGSEGNILAYNDENGNFKPLPFDFSRGSSATRVNKQGLIETVGANDARVDYLDNANGALLLEPTRTNLVTYSIPINSSPYNYAGGGVSPAPIHTANQGISPDGSLNAAKIDFNLNGGTTSSDISQISYVGSSLTGDYTSSFYLKSFDSNSYTVTLLNPNGVTSQTVITPEWQRFTFYNGGGTTSANLIRIRLRGSENTSNTASLLAWGFQLEQGSYPTSIINTQGTAQTRLADSCSQTLPSAVPTSGVIYAEIELFNSVLDTSSTAIRYGINQTTYSGNWIFFGIENGDNLRVYVRANDSTSFDYSSNNVFPTSGVYKIAMRFAPNDTKVFVNGVQRASSENTVIASNLNNLNISGGGTASSPVNNSVKNRDFRLYNTALTDSELAALTQV